MSQSHSDKIEYIASGCSYLRLNAPRNTEGESLEYLRYMLSQVKEHTNHKFGILYNACVESTFGPRFLNYTGIVDSIHSDSGGLQMITRGTDITPEIKQKIYTNQGENSNYAMSFDENPVKIIGDKSSRTNSSNRKFDLDHFVEAAKQTGINIRDQIDTFDRIGSNTCPIFIGQGNNYETYMRWTEEAMSQLDDDHKSRITSVALGASAIGYGFLEDIERSFYAGQLPMDYNHIHVLGVGSLRRLLPYLIFKMNGYYKDIQISYDSTTHTSGVEFGQFFKDGNTVQFNRQNGLVYELMYDDIKSMFDIPGSVDYFHECMNSGWTTFTEDNGNPGDDFLRIRTSFIIKSIINFCRHIDKSMESKSKLMLAANSIKLGRDANALYSVKTMDDFNVWYNVARPSMKSKRVNEPAVSIEGFFDD